MTRGPAWSEREINRLLRLREQGLSFAAISELIEGRTAAACQTRFYYDMAQRRVARGEPGGRIRAARQLRFAQVKAALAPAVVAPPIAPAAVAPPPREIPPPSGAAVSRAILIADAELRARIAVLGVTGGMLGDPLPGRSALDQKRRGET